MQDGEKSSSVSASQGANPIATPAQPTPPPVESPATSASETPTPEAKPTPKPKRFKASIYQSEPLPKDFVGAVLDLENLLGMPIWLLIQNNESPWGSIGREVFKGIQARRAEIPDPGPVALLIESPGGDAHFAYRIAKMFQRRSGNQLTVIVPQYAKSAATLLALGASSLILGRDAELGPLDVQMFDFERETLGSALDAVQALERLNAFALTAVDQTMFLLAQRTMKRTDIILPHILAYVSSFLRPILEKIDTVDYTRKSRDLKVAEEYAVRLMRQNYDAAIAKRIGRQLVERYPTHGFVIDNTEASTFVEAFQGESFGLGLTLCDLGPKGPEVEKRVEQLVPFLDELTAVGRVQEEP